jgi:hypothetical protein
MTRALGRLHDGDNGGERLSVRLRGELAGVLSRRGQDRLKAILGASDPSIVAQALSLPEVFYTYGDLDDDGRRSLVALLSDDQIDYLLDLDLWDRDEVDADRALAWIERLLHADPDLAVRWVLRADSNLVVAVLQKLVIVTEGPFGSQAVLSEAQDQLPPFTAEGNYYVHFKARGAERLLKELLIRIAGEDLEYYLSLLQDVIVMTDSQCGEDAYSRRWNRLRDQGFVPPEEAYDIYSWTGSAGSPDTEDAVELELDAPAPTALTLSGPSGLLASVVDALTDDERFDVSRSLVVAGARILSADHLPLGDLDAHRRSLHKALGYVNIGLEQCSGGDPARAHDTLLRTGCGRLFRQGYQSVADLGRRALALRRQGWISNQIGLGVELLDEPMGEVIAALARPRPLFPARALNAEGADREFVCFEEVARCSDELDRAEALRRLFIDGLGLDLAPAQVFDLSGCTPSEARELSLGLILRTAIAHLVLEGQLRFVPVDAGRLSELVRRFLAETSGDLLGSPLRDLVFSTLIGRIDSPTQNELRHLGEYLDSSLAELSSAVAGLDLDRAIDPRFVGAFVIRH